MNTPTRSVVLVTASEPEPRTFGKQVVLGGLLDHLVARLGAENVHVVLVGDPDLERPPVPYDLHVLRRPGSREQLRSLATRVLGPARSALQEAALWSPRLLREIGTLLDDLDADLQVWDTIRTAQYARALPRKRRVLYADDLFSLRYRSILAHAREQQEASDPLGDFGKMLPGPARRLAGRPAVYRPLLQLEQRLAARSEDRAPADFDATALVNPDETALLAQRSGSGSVVTLLPLLGSGSDRPRTFSGEPSYVFLGSLEFQPNRDALRWFLGTCREAVLAAVPDFRLALVGRGSVDALPEAAAWGDRVRPLGWVPDLDDVLLSAAGLLSPLQTGSGIKIKVLESLSRGLPVVATSFGVLGLDVDESAGCLVADDPAGLAAALARAADPDVNALLSAGARRRWDERYSPAVARQAYDEVLGLVAPDAGPA
ncbi:hypothetical protein GCM10022197_42150 [Microlunatus spumicola]|uniref:Uncharacterized protein n=1 Tax=Microlunatus spumicola TaxID=81499 RepID=A0ABP6YAE9_9ACTN